MEDLKEDNQQLKTDNQQLNLKVEGMQETINNMVSEMKRTRREDPLEEDQPGAKMPSSN